jgi:hypothetical protein
VFLQSLFLTFVPSVIGVSLWLFFTIVLGVVDIVDFCSCACYCSLSLLVLFIFAFGAFDFSALCALLVLLIFTLGAFAPSFFCTPNALHAPSIFYSRS